MLKYKIVLSPNVVELEGHVNKWMRDNDATPLGGVTAIAEENTPPPGTLHGASHLGLSRREPKKMNGPRFGFEAAVRIHEGYSASHLSSTSSIVASYVPQVGHVARWRSVSGSISS